MNKSVFFLVIITLVAVFFFLLILNQLRVSSIVSFAPLNFKPAASKPVPEASASAEDIMEFFLFEVSAEELKVSGEDDSELMGSDMKEVNDYGQILDDGL